MKGKRKGRAESWQRLRQQVISCKKCPRLREHSLRAAQEKKKMYRDWEYWGKPLPGVGDHSARLLIIGLAPAAHGGNRTGRMFTGDASGSWLIRALHTVGFANQPTSERRDDGLKLKDTYITAAVRCAPPENKPTRQEILNCSSYLIQEMKLLKRVKLVLTLGRVAFDAYLRLLRQEATPVDRAEAKFRHGAVYKLGKARPLLCVSYHPSPRNTQTGRLTARMWHRVFERIRSYLKEHERQE